MIRVLHLTTGMGVGGAESNLARLVCNMDRTRFANSVMALRRDEDVTLSNRLREEGIPFASAEMDPRQFNLVGLAKVYRLVRKLRPHILQTWMYHADLVGLVVGKLAGSPRIVWNVRCSLMDMKSYSWQSALVLNLLVRLSGMPSAVLCNSHAGMRDHQALGYRSRRWHLMPNSLDLDLFHPDREAYQALRSELGIAPDATVIGLVARFDPMKDHQMFIDAARLIAAKAPEAHFVFVGRETAWTNPRVVAMIEASGLRERFHLMGLRRDINRITAGLDVACSSSRFGEGASNAIAEAMACGVPCVVTDVGDSRLMVGDSGKVVAPGDAAAFAEACGNLLATPLLRQVLGRRAQTRARERFSVTAVAKRYEQLYEDLAHQSVRDKSPLRITGLSQDCKRPTA